LTRVGFLKVALAVTFLAGSTFWTTVAEFCSTCFGTSKVEDSIVNSVVSFLRVGFLNWTVAVAFFAGSIFLVWAMEDASIVF